MRLHGLRLPIVASEMLREATDSAMDLAAEQTVSRYMQRVVVGPSGVSILDIEPPPPIARTWREYVELLRRRNLRRLPPWLRVIFTVRGTTCIPASELREAEITWRSIGERGGIDGEPLDGDFHLCVEARIRAGLRRPCGCRTGRRFALRSTMKRRQGRPSARCSSRGSRSTAEQLG